MDDPFKTTPLHILPHDDLGQGGAYYISRKWLPGMLPIEELREPLYAYPMRGTKRQKLTIFAADGEHRDVVHVGLGTGGVIQEWWPGDGPQVINNAGEAGRSINQSLFIRGKGYHGNPTMAGDKFDIFFPDTVDPKIQEPPNNFQQHTLLHGGRLLGMHVDDRLLRVTAAPLEWDPDGTWKGMMHNHGGGVLTAREYEDITMDMEIDFHWGRAGLHRFTSICEIPEVDPKWGLQWSPLGLFLRFGYDDIYAYNGETDRLTMIRDDVLVREYRGSVLSWNRVSLGSGAYLLGELDQPHGRQLETRQNVIYGLGTDDDRPKLSSIFMDGPESTRIRIDPAPLEEPPRGELFAPAVKHAELSDVQMRYGYRQRMLIGGGSGLFNLSDQSGSYPTDIFGGDGGAAIVYRSVEHTLNPWSFQQDFAIALFVPFVDKLSGSPDTTSQRHLRWGSKRGKDTPTNGQKDGPVMILGDTYQWNAGLPKPGTRLQSRAYVLTGTMTEVVALLQELAGVADEF